MAEATLYQSGCALDYTPDAAITGGEVLQLKDGRAAVMPVDVDSGALGSAQVEGVYKIAKTANIVILTGGRVYWDHSANTATYKKVNDRDFYLGRATADAAAADSYVYVAINVDPPYDIDISRDAFLTVLAGTAAAGAFGYPRRMGGAFEFELTSTNEAQKVDALTVDGFAKGANAIVEAAFRVMSDGSGTAVDVSIGVANGTHATDADSITESLFVHLDANNTNINLESDDGTTEVAATDTTLDYTEGTGVTSRVEVWFDMRDPADVQIYVNGALALGSSVFNVDAATGPFYLLVHVEKTSSTDTYKLAVDWLRARLGQQ